uniref:Uncharacterized protein n=1 Tax=Anopheles dirus TaxID=7168 RepID=A0A182NWU3_9DIPT
MTPLHGTIALVQIDGIAIVIGKHLNFHMPRRSYVPFQQHSRITESLLGFCSSGLQHRHKISLGFGNSHSLSSTAPHCFDHQGESDLLSLLHKPLIRLILSVVPVYDGNTGRRHDVLGCALDAHVSDGASRRTDECNVLLLTQLGKFHIF